MPDRALKLNRRDFLQATATGVAAAAFGCQSGEGGAGTLDIVDCHTHFFDPTRPQGIPWPGEGSPLYRPTLPQHLRALPKPKPVTGTVIVEASSWLEDNQWLLDLADVDPFVLGIVGRLSPATAEFLTQLERFAKNPLFRGIRVGEADAKKAVDGDESWLGACKRLADFNLALDVNGGMTTPGTVARLAQKLPELRLVINHVGNVRIDGKTIDGAWRAGMQAAGKQPRVWCKVSALVEGANQRPAPADVEFYKPTLDVVWDAFGDDRLIYGSNWPVSDTAADYATLQQIVLDYVTDRGATATEKFFSLNSRAAYGWTERPGRLAVG